MRGGIWMLTCLLALVVVVGCSKTTNAQKILGQWHCHTQNPNGQTSDDTYMISANGRFAVSSDTEAQFGSYSGSYSVSEATITMVTKEIPDLALLGRSTSAHYEVYGSIVKLDGNTLEMNTMTQEGTQRRTLCKK
jgi:hypothetical protein